MNTLAKRSFVAAVLAGVAGTVIFFWPQIEGVIPDVLPPVEDIADLISKNETGLPLKLPPGVSVSIFAKLSNELAGPRAIVRGVDGNLYVSFPQVGTVMAFAERDGKAADASAVIKGLNNPHGLAFDPHDGHMLYIAAEDKIVRVDVSKNDLGASAQKILDLPLGIRHSTRTLGFGPDDRLYVSIGSNCDVCNEKDEHFASIWSLKRDGSDFKQVAKGLRNSVFFAWDYIFGDLWATEMGRDNLGDNLPPDEINIIKPGQNYGWPNCYGQNIHDDTFDKNTYIRNPCMSPFETPAYVDLPAHVAPLGIAFIPEEGWPEDWGNDAIVAEHGSWNSTVKVGYKLVRVDRDAKGNVKGVEDFVTGWMTPKGVLGRPVGILTQPGGVMYVTDDKANVIYRFQYGLTK